MENNESTMVTPWWHKLLEFDASTVPDYLSGRLKPDCTTIQVAAKAGCLDFLKWCADNGYASEFSSSAAGAALAAGHKDTFEWLIQSGHIKNYHHLFCDLDELAPLAKNLGVDTDLFWSIKELPHDLPVEMGQDLSEAMKNLSSQDFSKMMNEITPDMVTEFLKEHPDVSPENACTWLVAGSMLYHKYHPDKE